MKRGQSAILDSQYQHEYNNGKRVTILFPSCFFEDGTVKICEGLGTYGVIFKHVPESALSDVSWERI